MFFFLFFPIFKMRNKNQLILATQKSLKSRKPASSTTFFISLIRYDVKNIKSC